MRINIAARDKARSTVKSGERVWQTAGLRWLTLGALFLAALVPRGFQATFMTVDEVDHWFPRAHDFLSALIRGDFAATNLVGHPGVTTMWLGTGGILIHRYLAPLLVPHNTDPMLERLLMRLPVAIVTSACIVGAFPLIRRLMGRRVAILGTLFWAADPFLIAHSQLLHTDALLTTFTTLALLAALVAFGFDQEAQPGTSISWRMLVVSGLFGGLALLTKSPALVLLPTLFLILLVRAGRLWRVPGKQEVVAILLWVGVVLATWFVLWPATWVYISEAVAAMYREARYDGGRPHAWGNFFLGRAVSDPGPWFYSVAIVLRLTPWALVGVAGLAVAGLVWRRKMQGGATYVVLAIFVLAFVVGMSLGAKKFDRYVLPVFPAIDLLAAGGLIWLGTWLLLPLSRPTTRAWRRGPELVASLAVAAVLGLNVYTFHPYEMAYYNPMLGGGAAAARLIPIGWGEGYDQVASFIDSQPHHCDRPIATYYAELLRPYACDAVVPLEWAARPNAARYAVLYIDQVQRNNVGDVTAWLRQLQPPLHTVQIHGIDYATIYDLLPAVTHPYTVTFGSAIQFRGYALNTDVLRAAGAITATLQWQAMGDVPPETMLFAHLLDANGKHVGQVDVPLVGPQSNGQPWATGQAVWWDQRIPVPPDLPPGTYWLSLGVYDPKDFARWPLAGPIAPGTPDDSPNALRLPPLAIP